MNKPQMKKEVAIEHVLSHLQIIYFYSTRDAVTEFAAYGTIVPASLADYYCLTVDKRYDFQEVVDYMEAYG